jgi:glycosyltransferase involved in cell wall biosynthesis
LLHRGDQPSRLAGEFGKRSGAVKYLFVHQNFPGQYLHVVRHLVKDRRNDVVFVSEPNQNHIAGVRKIPYPKPEPAGASTHVAARDLDDAARRAEVVARIGTNLRGLGFSPDIIIGHHGWGELLNLPEVWPGVPILGYLEFFYRTDGADVGFDPEFLIPPADFPRIRAKNAVNLIALNMPGRGQTPTEWQLSTYPSWARESISLLREGVILDVCKPDADVRRRNLRVGDVVISPREKLVTYVARDLEPYRGFHVMMRALPHLLSARRDIRVVMVGGDGISYGAPPAKGTWREVMMTELGDRIDLSRVVFPGKVDYATYLRLLKRSDAHVYLTYPFVASWSLREALSAGCVVIGSDTPPVREFITDGSNGLLVSFFEPERLAERVLETLEDRGLAARLRRGARAYAERNLAMENYLDAFGALVGELVEGPASVADVEETGSGIRVRAAGRG